MSYRIIISLLFIVVSAAMLVGYSKEDGYGPYKPTPLKLSIPKGWSKPASDIFANNPLTEEGFQLGKKLFYDGRLSRDGQTSCGSCHQQFAAFSTYDHDLSHGVENSFTTRNAPALFNLAWMPSMHWDGGINHIEVQPLSPITMHNEMGETLEHVLIKIKGDPDYRRYFKAAFGDTAISSKRMLKALAQFTGSLISSDSRYDKWKRNQIKFTAIEEKGYSLYKQFCAACHTEPLFTDHSFRNNGLTLNRFADAGRQRITLLAADSLKFKVPSLRNVQYTGPYMHDGRFYDLYKVIDHYTGIDTTQPLPDPLLKRGIHITDKEKQQLVYFLYTLTDTSFTKNKRFAPEAQIAYKH